MEILNIILSNLSSALGVSAILGLAALGLIINEKAGVVNLGAEGMMLLAAVVGFATTVKTGSFMMGFIAGAVVGGVSAAVFGALVIWLNTNQFATGLALSIFGVGLANFVGKSYVADTIPSSPSFSIPFLSDIPVIGPIFFQQHPMFYCTIALAFALVWFYYKTRTGLILRSVGESPESAHALGYPVRRIRLLCLVVGGMLCGIAGAYLSLVKVGILTESMTSGIGWIALALTTFATWRPMRAIAGAFLFSSIGQLSNMLQTFGIQVPAELLNSLQYLAPIVALVLISRNPVWIRVNMPASLGKPFYP